MSKNNIIKDIQLGMPLGTAAAKLRKMVLFSLLVKHKENLCLRCGLPITCADDLSIDHIKNWLHIDVGLFWDIDNIGFSHRRCNKADRIPSKKVPPTAEQAWCGKCQSFLHQDKFSLDKNHWNGRANRCKKCHSIRNTRKPPKGE